MDIEISIGLDMQQLIEHLSAREVRELRNILLKKEEQSITMNEQKFMWGWKLIYKTWQCERHCLERGSSIETLTGWINKVNYRQKDADPWFIKQVLKEAERRDFIEIIKTRNSCTRYKLT